MYLTSQYENPLFCVLKSLRSHKPLTRFILIKQEQTSLNLKFKVAGKRMRIHFPSLVQGHFLFANSPEDTCHSSVAFYFS